MSDVFPIPAENKHMYGTHECCYCEVEMHGFHWELSLNLSKPDAGTGDDDQKREEVLFKVLEICETCWDERFGPVQHWYEYEYLTEGEPSDG